jgi:hypothetical protein
MLQSVFQRAAVAILLIACLIAPVGSCLQQTHKTAHSCCASMSQQHAAFKTDCCTVRPTSLAVIVSPKLPGATPLTTLGEFVSVSEINAFSAAPDATSTPPLSPSRASSILRI